VCVCRDYVIIACNGYKVSVIFYKLIALCVASLRTVLLMSLAVRLLQVVVTQEGVLGTHNWLPYDKAITNFFTFERDPLMNNVK